MNSEVSSKAPPILSFGDYDLDTGARVLRRRGVRVHLHSQPLRILEILLAKPRQVVTRTELQQELWPELHFGEFDVRINTAVRKLRRALGDSAEQPRWVETVATLGYRFIGEVDLVAPSSPIPQPASVAPPTGRRFVLAAGGLCVACLLLGWFWGRSGREPAPPLYRLQLPSPEGLYSAFSLSPDGSRLAFASDAAESRVWIQSLVNSSAFPLEGSNGADPLGTPFWSPNSSEVGFFANGKLKTAALAGGAPKTLCDAPFGRGGSWHEDGRIVFAPQTNGGLWIVDIASGSCRPLLELDDAAVGYRSPRFLPHSRDFLFTRRNDDGTAAIARGSLDSKGASVVVQGLEHARYVEPDSNGVGRLFYVRDNSLYSRPFNTKGETFDGPESRIATNVGYDVRLGRGMFDVSATGLLAFLPPEAAGRVREISWINRSGERIRRIATTNPLGFTVTMAPDEEWAVVWAWSLSKGTLERYIQRLDLTTGITTTLTEGRMPALSRAGDRIFLTTPNGLAFRSLLDESTNVFLEVDSILTTNPPGARVAYCDYLESDDAVLFQQRELGGAWDLNLIPLGGGEPQPLLAEPFSEVQGQFSPDGRILAYVSDETGRPEVYIRRYPSLQDRMRVSQDGGDQPRWRADGSELFYVRADGMLMATEMRTTASGTFPGRPTSLFMLSKPDIVQNLRPHFSYAAAADAQRFLALLNPAAPAVVPLRVVTNWEAAAGVN